MTKQKLLKLRTTLLSLGALALVFVLGYHMGRNSSLAPRDRPLNLSLGNGEGLSIDRFVSGQTNPDFNLYWKVWERLKDQYIDREKLTDTQLLYSSIKGLVSATEDPYTVFLTPDENKRAQDDLAGAFEGVGIQLGYKEYFGEDRLAVISALEGNPAVAAGVKDGDLILKIDGEDTFGMSLPDAVERIRGEKGTVVTLALLTEGEDEPHDIPITRGTISVPSVEMDWIDKVELSSENSTLDTPPQIAHLRVIRFGEQTTTEWNKKIAEIRNRENVAGIILDLRGNPGGFFQGAIELGSDLVDSGVIVMQESADGYRQSFRASGSARLVDYPLVILVNKGSASASEILAGAVRELRPGVQLVGQNTFGKGSVQEAIDLEGNSGLHITIYRWLLPSGKNIDKEGIPVDVEVENDPETEEDEQLTAAIEQFSD